MCAGFPFPPFNEIQIVLGGDYSTGHCDWRDLNMSDFNLFFSKMVIMR